jgi:hypothetical protein
LLIKQHFDHSSNSWIRHCQSPIFPSDSLSPKK